MLTTPPDNVSQFTDAGWIPQNHLRQHTTHPNTSEQPLVELVFWWIYQLWGFLGNKPSILFAGPTYRSKQITNTQSSIHWTLKPFYSTWCIEAVMHLHPCQVRLKVFMQEPCGRVLLVRFMPKYKYVCMRCCPNVWFSERTTLAKLVSPPAFCMLL